MRFLYSVVRAAEYVSEEELSAFAAAIASISSEGEAVIRRDPTTPVRMRIYARTASEANRVEASTSPISKPTRIAIAANTCCSLKGSNSLLKNSFSSAASSTSSFEIDVHQ